MSKRRPDSYDPLAFRLTDILRRLNAGEKLDPQSLATEYGINVRTIQRDLNERFAFLELQKKDGRYFVSPRHLGVLSLDEIQRFAGLAGLQGQSPQLSTDFLREILSSSLQEVLLVRPVPGDELVGLKQEQFQQLKRAIEKQQVVSFDYLKPEGIQRVQVNPYKLAHHRGLWYLAAAEWGQLKSFSFGKMDCLQILPELFEPDAAIRQIVSEEDSVWLNVPKTEVQLKVARPAALFFQRRHLISGQKIEQELEDGSLLVSGKIDHPDQILPIVRYWMPNIRILSPKQLQVDLKKEIQDYLDDF